MLETGVIFFGLLQSRLLDVATYATGDCLTDAQLHTFQKMYLLVRLSDHNRIHSPQKQIEFVQVLRFGHLAVYDYCR